MNLKSELENVLTTHSFRGAWISTRKETLLDMVAIAQVYMQRDKQSTFRILMAMHELKSNVMDYDDQSKTWFVTVDVVLRVLALLHQTTVDDVKMYIANTFGGQLNVPTQFGVIDILTSTHAFIVGEIYDWEQALGRLIAHSPSFPMHVPILVIRTFEKEDRVKMEYIEQVCSDYDIKPLRVFKNQAGVSQHTFMGTHNCDTCGRDIHQSHQSDSEDEEDEDSQPSEPSSGNTSTSSSDHEEDTSHRVVGRSGNNTTDEDEDEDNDDNDEECEECRQEILR